MNLLTKTLALVLTIFVTGSHIARAADPDILSNYLKIHDALAADTLEGVTSAAKTLAKSADAGKTKDPMLARVSKSATALAGAKSLESARKEFKPLSDAMIEWNSKAKNPGVEQFHCSMAPGSWLQKSGPTENPYYGKQMLRCGEKR